MGQTSFTDVDAQHEEQVGQGGFNPIGDGSNPVSNAALTVPAAQGSNGTVAVTGGLDLSGTGIEGEVRRQDVNIPKLTITNALSKSRTEGDKPLGSLVYADEVVLAAPKKGDKESPKLTVFVLAAKKGYQKHVPFGSDEKIVRADTAAEVRALGGTLDRKDKTKVLFEETAQIMLLIPAPEGLEEMDLQYFRHEHEGKRYAQALFFVKSIAYTGVFKPIATRVNNLGEKTYHAAYELHASFVDGDKFKWWTPKLKATRLTTPAERAFIETKLPQA